MSVRLLTYTFLKAAGLANFSPVDTAKEVFHHLVQKGLQKECVVVRSASEVMAYRPWAYYFVEAWIDTFWILVSRNIFSYCRWIGPP